MFVCSELFQFPSRQRRIRNDGPMDPHTGNGKCSPIRSHNGRCRWNRNQRQRSDIVRYRKAIDYPGKLETARWLR